MLPAAPVAAATAPALPPSSSLGKSLITRFAQNLRGSASTTAAITGSVRAWESVSLLDATAGWVKVAGAQGQVGWLGGNAVLMRDTDLPYWAAPLYEMAPGSWQMSLYPTRAVGTWVSSAPIRATNSATATIIGSVKSGEQLHLLSVPEGEYVPVLTQGGLRGWISRYQLMGAPTLARTEEVALTQVAPDRFRLELHGNIGSVAIAGGALQIGLPAESNRRGNLAVKTAGIERLRWEPSGLVIPLTSQVGYTVIAQSATSLTLELGAVAVSPPTTPEEPAVKTVIIDPGHGGEEPGASGNGVVEKLLTLDMANRVTAKLQAQGIRVVMTHTDDNRCGTPAIYTGLTLYERGRKDLACRADLTAQERANLFLSIHYNSLPDTEASGTETYYSPTSNYIPESKRLAGLVQAEVVQAAGLIDRGVRSDDFYVITYTAAPSALVELGFLSSASDVATLTQAATKDRVATALARGITRYFE